MPPVTPEMFVSIHAPARGRPDQTVAAAEDLKVSIHAPARGRRRNYDLVNGTLMFRSTPPRGGDLPTKPAPCGLDSFDPRPREGATVNRDPAGA